jgi:hypothetical protein
VAGYYADRVKETSETTGTGDVTLEGAVVQFLAFSDRFEVGQQLFYAIVEQTGSDWEVGQGYLSGATTLVRERVLASTNADALVNFGAGTKDVFSTIPAESADQWEANGEVAALVAGAAML